MTTFERTPFEHLALTRRPTAFVVNFKPSTIVDPHVIPAIRQELSLVVELAQKSQLPFVLSFRGVKNTTTKLVETILALREEARLSCVRWNMCALEPPVAMLFRRLGPSDGDAGIPAGVAPLPSSDGGEAAAIREVEELADPRNDD